MRREALVFAGAIAFDLAVGEAPGPIHPVAWLGKGVAAAERRLPRGTPSKDVASGLAVAGAFPVMVALSMAGVARLLRRSHPLVALAGEALLLKQTFAIRSLFDHVEAVRQPLGAGEIAAAREAVARIVSRRTEDLDVAGVASAAIESMTENLSDSVVAPWAWYAVGGLPAAAAYRAVNTIDAMVGYRSKGVFGTPGARLDDVANFIPARLTALFLGAASGQTFAVHRRCRAYARATASPNSGWPMAVAAVELGVRLEKVGHHVLNTVGRPPGSDDIQAGALLSRRALALAASVFVLGLALRGGSRA